MTVSELQNQINTFRQYTVADMIAALQQLPQDAIVSAGSTMYDWDYNHIYRPSGSMLHFNLTPNNNVSIIDEEIGFQLHEDMNAEFDDLYRKQELLIVHSLSVPHDSNDDNYEAVKLIGLADTTDDYEIVCACDSNENVSEEIEFYMQDETGPLLQSDNMTIAYSTHDFDNGRRWWVIFKRIPNPLYKIEIKF